MKKVDILGIQVSSISKQALDSFMFEALEKKSNKLILYTNIYGMNLARKYNWMETIFNRSDILLCDGTGVILGSKIIGTPIKERISLTDWGWELAKILNKTGHSLFLLGSTHEIVSKAAERLRMKYTDLNIAGYHDGFFNMEGDENMDVISKINSSGADVLLIGMGMPRQEKWILENRELINSKIIITGGAVFNYFAGIQKRSPKWISRWGLEWFHRFLHEPVRLFPRYFPGNFKFLFRIFKKKWR